MSRLGVGLVLWVAAIAPAWAFLGVGDVTFDPPVHAELVSLLDQTLAIYRTALREVRRLQTVEATLREANRDARAIANGDLVHYEERGLPHGLPQGLRALLADTGAAADNAGDYGGYLRQQAHRFGRLARLRWLRRGVRRDARLSATSLGMRTSGEVTARSTATLADLAAVRARSRERRAIRRAAERRNARHLPREAASLYRAFGGSHD